MLAFAFNGFVVAQNYDFSHLETVNPYIKGNLAAGLYYYNGLNDSLTHFSNALISSNIQNGKFRNPYTSDALCWKVNFETKSIIQFKDLTLLAHFGYQYEQQKNVRFNTIYETNSSPFFYSDSLFGNTKHENFTAGLKAAYHFKKIADVGISVDYLSASRAKTRDLRNEVDCMKFSIAGDVLFRVNKKWKSGLNMAWKRHFENLEVQQIAAGVNNNAFIFSGLWFYNPILFSPTSNYGRRSQSNVVSANLYNEFQIGNGFLFVNLGVSKDTNHQYFKNYEEFGDYTRKHYFGEIRFVNASLLINASYQLDKMLGYSVLQRSEVDTLSGSPQYSTKAKYETYFSEIQQVGAGVYYRKTDKHNLLDEKYKIGLIYHFSRNYQSNLLYPVDFFQRFYCHYSGIHGSYSFVKNNDFLQFDAQTAYSFGYGRMLDHQFLNGNNDFDPQNYTCMTSLLEQEYRYNTDPKIIADIFVKYKRKLLKNRNLNLVVSASYNGNYSLSYYFQKASRNSYNVAIGLEF
jgi:hypothetical protein